MSKLTALCGKIKEDLVLKGEDGSEIKVTLKAPLVEDLAEISELFTNGKNTESVSKEQMASILKIAKRMIKESVPDATDEEINEVVLQNMNTIVMGIISLLNKSFGGIEKKIESNTPQA
jgi:HEPN domain-containing protein